MKVQSRLTEFYDGKDLVVLVRTSEVFRTASFSWVGICWKRI